MSTSKNKDQCTPFYFACQNGHPAVVALLMTEPRVDVNLPSNEKCTPFFAACESGRTGVVALLVTDPQIDRNGSGMMAAHPSSSLANKVTLKWFHCSWLMIPSR